MNNREEPMSFQNWCFCILAAGEGKRMISSQPKVILPVLGKPLINYLLDTASDNHLGRRMVVVSPLSHDSIRQVVDPQVKLVIQKKPLGTADAVKSILPHLDVDIDKVLIVYADMPLLHAETLSQFMSFFEHNQTPLALLTTESTTPTGFGRIIRNSAGVPLRIIEEKDCTLDEKKIPEINLGIYAFQKEFMGSILSAIDNQNIQGEYYLTDVLEVAQKQNFEVSVYTVPWDSQFTNVNSPRDLSTVISLLHFKKIDLLFEQGVKILDPNTTYIDWDVRCERDIWLYPGTILEGKTEIHESSIIGPYTRLVNSRVGRGCHIEYSVVEDSLIEDMVLIGPFAHLRMNAHVKNGARIGNFVEVKKSVVGEETKALHHSYLGDAQLGKRVNIGAGTITCNFDGRQKHPTIIYDQVFIGSNNSLVAPVTIGEGAYTAAGSTITRDVPPLALGIGRARQVNIEKWVEKKKNQELMGK